MVENSNFGNSSFAILAGGRASRMRQSAESVESALASDSVSKRKLASKQKLDSSVLDKCLLSVGGATILERIVSRLGASDFSSSALNANGDLARFSALAGKHGLELLGDLVDSTEPESSLQLPPAPESSLQLPPAPESSLQLPPAPSSEQFPPPLLGPLAGLLSSMRWARDCGSRWLLTVPGDCPFLPSDLFSRLRLRQSASGSPITCAASREADGSLHGTFRRHPVTALWDVSLHADLADSLLSRGVRKIDLWTSGHSVAIEEWDSPLDFFFNVNSRADLARANSLARTDFRQSLQ